MDLPIPAPLIQIFIPCELVLLQNICLYSCKLCADLSLSDFFQLCLTNMPTLHKRHVTFDTMN